MELILCVFLLVTVSFLFDGIDSVCVFLLVLLMTASFQPDGIGSVCLCSFPNADKDVTHGLTGKLLSCKFRMQSRASRNWIVEVGPQDCGGRSSGLWR